MGQAWPRFAGERSESDAVHLGDGATNPYAFPPASNRRYFGDYYMMGGDRFERIEPVDFFLFGANSDINYLNSPVQPFKHEPAPPGQPIAMMQSLIHIRKDTLHLVKVMDESCVVPRYRLAFVFDANVRCSVTIHQFASEKICSESQTLSFEPRDPTRSFSSPVLFEAGANQVFSAESYIIEPTLVYDGDEEAPDWSFPESLYREQIPLVVHITADPTDPRFLASLDCVSAPSGASDVSVAMSPCRHHSHATFASLDVVEGGEWVVKPQRQKTMLNGVCFLLQEVFGVENKVVKQQSPPPVVRRRRASGEEEEAETNSVGETESLAESHFSSDSSQECVVCMSEARDTLILPCRHLCLCYTCANSLRYQENNCPICRTPFRALLQIRGVVRSEKRNSGTLHGQLPTSADCSSAAGGFSAARAGGTVESNVEENIPIGYEAVPIIEALDAGAGPREAHTVRVPRLRPSSTAAAGGGGGERRQRSQRASSSRSNLSRSSHSPPPPPTASSLSRCSDAGAPAAVSNASSSVEELEEKLGAAASTSEGDAAGPSKDVTGRGCCPDVEDDDVSERCGGGGACHSSSDDGTIVPASSSPHSSAPGSASSSAGARSLKNAPVIKNNRNGGGGKARSSPSRKDPSSSRRASSPDKRASLPLSSSAAADSEGATPSPSVIRVASCLSSSHSDSEDVPEMASNLQSSSSAHLKPEEGSATSSAQLLPGSSHVTPADSVESVVSSDHSFLAAASKQLKSGDDDLNSFSSADSRQALVR